MRVFQNSALAAPVTGIWLHGHPFSHFALAMPLLVLPAVGWYIAPTVADDDTLALAPAARRADEPQAAALRVRSRELRTAADAADTLRADAIVTIAEALCAVNRALDAEVHGRECTLISFMDTLARGCCDAIPNGDTVDALASDPEYGRDDDDGGVEWKLPFRSAYFVWQMYVQAVELPYSYPRFIVKWSQLCPHIKRAGNTLLRCCANVGWTGMSVQLEFVLLCDCC